jgi:hypothetical protein
VAKRGIVTNEKDGWLREEWVAKRCMGDYRRGLGG